MATNSFIELLKQRVAQAKEELTQAAQRRIDAQALENTLMEEIRGYERTLAAELRRSGITPSERSDAPQRAVDAPLEIDAPHVESNGHKSAVQSILSYIRAAGARGITRGEIRRTLESEGIKVHRNYPYVVVAKLKEAKKIREEDERLYIQ